MLNATIQTPDVSEFKDGESQAGLIPLEGLSDEQFRALAESIMIVIPYRSCDGISPGICNHFGMWGRLGMRVATIRDPFGGFIEITRGSIVDMFMKYSFDNPKVKYLVMIDNDEGINWDAPLKLAQNDVPMISGVVCGYNSKSGIFACFMVKDENGIPRFPLHRPGRKLPDKGLMEVERCGMGLVCIRRDVLESLEGEAPFMLPEQLRREAVSKGYLPKGEDIVFCERVREKGYKIMVDCGVHATHNKSISINWPPSDLSNEMTAADWKSSHTDYAGF